MSDVATVFFYVITGIGVTLAVTGLVCMLFPIKLIEDRNDG